jgi:hypothetical protein
MKKSKSGCKTSILLFLIGVLIFFLALGSMKEGETNNTSICPTDTYISNNNPNKCCKENQGWYVSKNNNSKCCPTDNNKVIGKVCFRNNYIYNGFSKNSVNTIPASPPPPTNQATLDLFNQFDSNRDNLLSEEEIVNLVTKKYPPEQYDDNIFYSKVDSLVDLDKTGNKKVSYNLIESSLVDYL